VRRNADRAAQGYLAAASLEQEVGRRMLERLEYVKLTPKRILDAGSGPSPQAGALKKRYRDARIVALDHSLAMLRQVEAPGLLRRLAGGARTLAVCADFVRLPLAARSFSLVWSNMALHWGASPQAALAEFHRVLEVEGLLMFSTVGPDTLKELRTAFAGRGGAPHVHSFIDMHDLGDMLVAAGFAAPVMDTETITLTYPGVDALTADLRSTGQACALEGRSRGLLGPRCWKSVCGALESTKREGRLAATVEVVYGHAWKAAPRRTPEGHAVVNFGNDRHLRN
jgi:malonyl-CoA O-methyltransferase